MKKKAPVKVRQLDELYVAESGSEEFLWYFICVDEDGYVRCDCPGYINHGKCKHAQEVLEAE